MTCLAITLKIPQEQPDNMDPAQERQPSPSPSSTRSSRLPVDTSSTSNLLADDGQRPPITSLESPQAPQPAVLNNRGSQTPNLDIPRVGFQVEQHTDPRPPSPRSWRWPSWSSLLDRLVGVTGRNRPRAAPGSASSPGPVAGPLSGGRVWREWRSKKLGSNWLTFQFILTLGIGAAVFGLGEYSRINSGFIRLGSPPAFISDNPDLMKAIWMQGWQYTTVPVSLMTLYRVMWDGIVAAIAERQPYVELMKEGGAPPEKTLLLDYRAEWQIIAPYKAFKTGHWFLGLCMVMSVVLNFGVVPSIAFLFTTEESAYRYPVPLTFESVIDYSAIRHPPPSGPSGGMALEWAAATGLMNAPPLSWTNGTSAFPTFALTNDLPTPDNRDPVPITVNSTAYLVRPNCIPLRENVEYSSTLVAPQIPGLSTAVLLVRGTDRNCSFNSDLLFNLKPQSKEFKPMAAKIFQRISCQQTADPNNLNGTRLTLVSGKYTGDRDKGHHSVSNVSVVSCNPTYWAVPGILNLTLVANPSNITTTNSQSIDNTKDRLVARITSFEGDWSRAVRHLDGEHLAIEGMLLLELAFDPSLNIQVPTNSLARFAFEIAARSRDNQSGHDEAPQPSALAKSMGDLFERAYTVIAATILTTPLPRTTHNETGNDRDQVGYASISETRIVVQQGVSYFVISMLSIVAGLLMAILLHERHKRSALFEEPIGLLGVAGITQRSEHLKIEINKLNDSSGFCGKFREDALEDEKFMATNWRYDLTERHIYETNRGRVERMTRSS